MRSRIGNLLDLADAGEFDVIVHGCNCMNVMGAGIAKQIAHRYPAAYQADQATVRGAYEKMGRYTSAVVTRPDGSELVVVNAYTQYSIQGPQPRVSYSAVREAFSKIAMDFPTSRIGLPMIGAGLAGGDWDVLVNIIRNELGNCDATVVVLESPPPGGWRDYDGD